MSESDNILDRNGYLRRERAQGKFLVGTVFSLRASHSQCHTGDENSKRKLIVSDKMHWGLEFEETLPLESQKVAYKGDIQKGELQVYFFLTLSTP